jgi:hypothetical protein
MSTKTDFEIFYDKVVEKYKGRRLPANWQIEDMYDAEYYGYRRDDPYRWAFLKHRKEQREREKKKKIKVPQATVRQETVQWFIDSLRNLSDYNYTKEWHPINITLSKGPYEDSGEIIIESNLFADTIKYRIKGDRGERVNIDGVVKFEATITEMSETRFNNTFKIVKDECL